MTEDELPRLSYTIPQALKATGLSRTTFYDLVRRGELQTFGIGPKRKFVRADVLAGFIDRMSGREAA